MGGGTGGAAQFVRGNYESLKWGRGGECGGGGERNLEYIDVGVCYIRIYRLYILIPFVIYPL